MKLHTIFIIISLIFLSSSFVKENPVKENLFIQKCTCHEKRPGQYLGEIKWIFQDTVIEVLGKKYFKLIVLSKTIKEDYYVRMDRNKLMLMNAESVKDSVKYGEDYKREMIDERVLFDFDYPNEKSWKLETTRFFNAAEFKLKNIEVVSKDTIYEFENICKYRLSNTLFIKSLKFSKTKGFIQLGCSLTKFDNPLIIYTCNNRGKMIKW